MGPQPGLALWREPLVWAWSGQPLVALPNPLPLALFPEPCPYREAALTRLAQAGIAQRSAPEAEPRLVEIITQVVVRYGAVRRH